MVEISWILFNREEEDVEDSGILIPYQLVIQYDFNFATCKKKKKLGVEHREGRELLTGILFA